MYDAIVVGARCAGAATAMLLSRMGYRVLLIDRASFPSDTMSTLYIHQPGIALLRKWGLLDAVAEAGTPKLTRLTYATQDVTVHGPIPALGDVDGTYAPRRHILDQIVVDAAVAAGTEFRDRTKVVGLLRDGDRVTGVRLRTAGGREAEERAHLVVGADGMRSTVARLADAAHDRSDPLMTCVYYGVWENLEAHFEFYERPGNWISVIPTNDARTVVSTYFPQASFSTVRKDPMTWFEAGVRHTAPGLHERMAQARQVERLRGTGEQRNFRRRPFGPGWCLVGDAGCHKDTITARGITDAFIQADLLVNSAGRFLQEATLLDSALANFAKKRDQVLAGPYRTALEVARLEIPASRTAMLKIISESPCFTESYLAVLAGIKPLSTLLTPELLEQLS
ncbi:NAD(P)/FAD-dependent oxidoreductase [Streptomyces griseoloalbus]|uniref:NAD(P)/FAD-dependent oxidoreductase n=1 Tax=Streptomyces griseoloalbus TaxID=67303 RepID=UPI00339F7087